MPEWVVIYRAVADFSDLTRKAAEALAEMEAIKKAADRMGQAELAYGPKVVASREADVKAMRAQADAMDMLSQKGHIYNRWVNWQGNQSPEQYLAYLQREDQYLRLLNIQRQRGFYSVYQDYAFRNQELAQRQLWNRAEQQGYATPEQYLTYLANLRHAMEMQNAAYRDRVNALAAATTASVAYANAVGGTHLSAQQLLTGATAAQAALAALDNFSATPTATLSDDQLRGAVLLDQRLLAQLSDDVATPSVTLDSAPALSGVAMIRAALASLDASRNRVTVGETFVPSAPPPMTGGTDTGAGPPVTVGGGGTTASAVAAAAAAKSYRDVAAAEVAARNNAGPLGASLDQMAVKWATVAVDSSAAGRGMFGAANIKVAAFGGLLGGIALWHVALDGIIEVLAILIPSIVTMVAGLGAWGLAAAQTGQQVYQHMKDVLTVSSALNQTVPPLTGAFVAFQNAVRPQVLELFGEGLIGLQKNTGVFQKLALDTGNVLDRFGARVLYDFEQGGKGLQTFFSVGEHMLAGLGAIVANLTHLFTGLVLVTTHTHIAEDLLAIAVAVSHVLGVVGSLIRTPVGSYLTAFALGLHGLWLWGGLAATGLQQLGLQATALLNKVPVLSDAMSGLARGLGATNDQLAGMGFKSRGLDNLAQGIINGDGAMVTFARDTGVSDANLAKLVARQPEIRQVADALGQSAEQVAAVAVGMAKSSSSMDEFAARMAGGEAKFTALKAAATGVESNVANIAIAAGAAAPQMEKLARGVATAAEDAPKANIAMSAFNGLVSLGTKYWPLLAAAAVAGLGVLLYHLATAKDATQQWLDTMQQGLQSATSPTAGFNSLIQDLADTNAKLLVAQASQQGFTKALASGGQQIHSNNAALTSSLLALPYLKRQQLDAAQGVGELNKGLQLQEQQFNNVTQFVGKVAAAYGTDLVGALGLADLAGVKFSDMMQGPQTRAFQTAILQIAGLVAGYQAMGQQSGIVGQDMNVLAVAASNQLKSMQQLNGAWDTFTKLVAGPVDSFLAWDNAIRTFNQDALQSGAAMAGLGTNVVTLGTAAARQQPVISNAAIQLQQQFQSVYSSTQQMFDAFRGAQAINGGSGSFIQFVKASVAELIPLAGSNKAAAAEISALAQEAGGPATTSLSQLAKWAGNIKDPMLAAYNATQQMTVATSNLSLDAQQLANSLASDMTALVKNSVEMAYITPLMNSLVTAIQKFGAGSQQAFDAQQNLYKGIATVTGSTQEANTVVGLLTGTMTGNLYVTGKTTDAIATLQKVWASAHAPASRLNTDLLNITQAAALYGTKSPQYQQAIQQAITDTANLGVSTQNAAQLINQAATQVLPRATQSLIDWAKNGLGYSTGGAQMLTTQLQSKLGPQLNQMGDLTLPSNKKSFIDWAENGLGYSKEHAFELWQEMVTLQAQLGIVSSQSVPTAKSQFEQWANDGLRYATGKADDLWSALVTKLGPQLDHLGNLSVPNVKNRFIDWAENSLHLSQQKAHDLWAELVTLQGQIDAMHGKNVTVGVTATGSGGITISGQHISGAQVQQILLRGMGASNQQLGNPGSIGHAAGGRINGYAPNSDTVPAMLSPGEYVLTPEAAAGIGYSNLDRVNQAYSGRTPGARQFASGGLADLPGAVSNAVSVDAGMAMLADAQAGVSQLKKLAAMMSGGANGMLAFMLSKLGHPYSETLGRFGPTYFDCSGLVYDAAHAAGIPLPLGDAIASSEADWFAGWGGDSTINRNQVQRGDLVFFVGASPDPSNYGPIGHVGMAVSNSQMVSALGTAYGVTISDIGSDFVIGVRLGGGAPTPSGPRATGGAQAYAQSQLSRYGWGSDQWGPLYNLWQRESGWNAYAVNPSSGAAGIPQNISGWTAYAPGDYQAQVDWGLQYIAGRYGSPAAAWAHEVSQGWYGAGGRVLGDLTLSDGKVLSVGDLIARAPSSVGDIRGEGMASGGAAGKFASLLKAARSGHSAIYGAANALLRKDSSHLPRWEQTALGEMRWVQDREQKDWASLAFAGGFAPQRLTSQIGTLGSWLGTYNKDLDSKNWLGLRRKWPHQYDQLGHDVRVLQREMGPLQAAWNAAYGPGPGGYHGPVSVVAFEKMLAGMKLGQDYEYKAANALLGIERAQGRVGHHPLATRKLTAAQRRLFGDIRGAQNQEQRTWAAFYNAAHGNAMDMNPALFSDLSVDLSNYNESLYRSWIGLRRYWPQRYDQLGHTIRVLQREVGPAMQLWEKLYDANGGGPGHRTGAAATPGPGGLPVTPWVQPPVNLPMPAGIPSGIYNYQKFAGGGRAGGLGSMLSQMSVMPQHWADGGMISAMPAISAVSQAVMAPPSKQSAAGSAAHTGMAAGGAVVTFGDINIHNPVPEAASNSLTSSTQKAAFMAGRVMS